MFDKIKDHPILVLLSMLVGAFLAGISALIFIQQQVDAGVQQQLRLQKPAFIKEISGALANVIPKPSPPIIEKSPEFFGGGMIFHSTGKYLEIRLVNSFIPSCT